MSDSNDLSNHAILKLTPQEKSVYSHLFSLADSDSLGVVTGERAVSFFEKTHVPSNVLGEIWQIADTENRGLLTKPGFCMVLRLIGWYQNGSQPSTELAFKPAPLPKFDGVAAPQEPQTTGQQAQSPTTGQFPQSALQPQLSGQGPIRVPPLDPNKVQQYSGLFERSGANNGLLDGGSAKGIFEKAGLPNEVLGKIWMLSDRDQRGALDQTEFIIAMHLLTSMKTRAMTALPTTLPQGLYEAAARRGQRPPSRQSSVPASGLSAVPRQLTGGQAQPRAQSPLARAPGYGGTPPPVSAQTTGAPWLITQQEKSQYDRFFATIDTSNTGIISGEQAVRFFSDSRLPEDTLASIWDLADINSEGQLNKDEFAVAMYLIRQQRAPNAPPLPAFLPPGLIPPSMRGQQQSQQSTAPTFDTTNAPPQPPAQKSASEDLFGLDSSPTRTQQPTLQPQGTGVSTTRDPFGGSQPDSPSSPQRFQPQSTGAGSMFKPFMPTSAFGTSLAQQHTGQSATSSQGQQQQMSGFQQPRSAPTAMDDLLGDNDTHAEESSKLTNETTELANMSNQIGNLRNQMETTQSKKAATSADLNATNQQKQQLEQRLQQFRTQYEAEVRAVKELEQQLAASKESTKKLGQDLAMIEGTHQDLQTQHQTVNQQLQADQQENANLKQRIAQINSEVTSLKPQIEKMKLDARQQKGMVSINKKQLSTNEGERDRLQSEKGDLEREAEEASREAAASPESFPTQSRDVASPAASTMSSTNPFFRMTSSDNTKSPPAESSFGPTPSAFDSLFGPSAHFAPSGQAASRSGTPPATSFIGRAMPAAAAGVVGGAALGAGGMAMADSMSSAGEPTPSATPPLSENAKDSPAASEPPPPPESRQFTPTNLPMGGGLGDAQSDAGSSTNVVPPAGRAGEPETPGPLEREIVPGAFPDDEAQPVTTAQEVAPSTGPSTQAATPAVTSKTTDDFDSAFAGFGGGGESSKQAENNTTDPFAPSQPAPQARGFGSNSEFPPIQNIESEDDSSSDDDSDAGGFGDDNFADGSPQQDAQPFSTAALTNGPEGFRPRVASGDDLAAGRPEFRSMESTASDLPAINKEMSPPSYEQSDSTALGGSGERTESNNFPPEFGNLLPAREDPTSPPPPATSPPVDDAASAASTLQPNDTGNQSVVTPSTDTFVDAFSRPMSMATDTSPPYATAPAPESLSRAADAPEPSAPESTTAQPPAAKNAFDDFDDFEDLSEAKEADDKTGDNFDFGFPDSRQSTDDFNPAFDTPAQNTPMTRSLQPSQDSTFSNSMSTSNNGADSFSAFAPSQSTTSAFASGNGNGGGSIGGNSSVQQTPQNVQHDWDAIFSGLDSSKAPDTSLGSNANATDDPWGTSVPSEPTTTTGSAAPAPATVPAGTVGVNGAGTNQSESMSAFAPPPGPPPSRSVGTGAMGAPPAWMAPSSTPANVTAPSSTPANVTASKAKETGRAITPGTEHDDPILKRLTTMGYARQDALNALEMFDYDINKAVDHLAGS